MQNIVADDLIRILSALLTPTIGVIAAYIAYQQAITNRRQHRLALFDRRMHVFNSTMNLLASIMETAKPDFDELIKFIRETRDHEFLFGPEVAAHINEIYKRGVELRLRNQLIEGQVGRGEERKAAIDRSTELLEWFAGQMAVTRKTFLKYLDFRNP